VRIEEKLGEKGYVHPIAESPPSDHPPYARLHVKFCHLRLDRITRGDGAYFTQGRIYVEANETYTSREAASDRQDSTVIS